jgi:hypothetical protein
MLEVLFLKLKLSFSLNVNWNEKKVALEWQMLSDV